MEQLRQRLAGERRDTERTRAQMSGLQALLEQKGVERARVLGLYRKGRIERRDAGGADQEIAAYGSMLSDRVTLVVFWLESVTVNCGL